MVDIVVQYRDGGEDRFYNVANSSCRNGILMIEESNGRTVCIVLDVITFWTKEEVKDEEDSVPF